MAGEQVSRRWSVLPRLLAQAPPRARIAVGVAVAVLGVLIVARPLTSLLLLGVYVGVSAIVSGLLELVTPPQRKPWWQRVLSVAWMLAGLVVLVFLGASLNLLPTVLAMLLLLGGIASLAEAAASPGRRLPVSSRVLAATWGGAQMAFGILSLTWPNVTVLVVAVVFGVRTLVFGLVQLVRGIVTLARRPDRGGRVRHPRPRRRWPADAGRYALAVLLVAVTVAGGFLNGWLQDGAPVVDAFYDPPARLPDGHGQVIRSDDYHGTLPPGARVLRMLYTTTDEFGAQVPASALVIVPDTDTWQPRPVVLWNHGTTGVARGCAPSLRDDTATRWAIPALNDALAHGWVVVAPDYAGQGAPGVFPYLIGEGEARSALDAVRAAARLPGVWLSDEVVVWGHSQGGHAALWASQIARRYTPDLHVLGTVALAPAAEPLSLARDLTSGYASVQLTVLTAWVLVPYSETYPDVQIADYVSPGTRAVVRELAQRCPSEPGLIVSVVAALGVSERQPLYIGDLTAGALGHRLAQNGVRGTWDSPLLIAWGDRDEVIPRSQQTALVRRLCAAGNDAQGISYPTMTHQRILQPGSPLLPKLVDWTAGLFAHRPEDGSHCPRD